MKKIFLSAFLVFLLVTPVFAEANSLPAVSEVELPSPGLTPDNPFYFLKEWKESIQTFFTFGAENQAKQFLHLADVRLAEYRAMVEKGKTEIAQKTLDEYQNQLQRATDKLDEVKRAGKETAALSTEIGQSVSKHLQVLNENLAKVPEAAKVGIEKAIEASGKVLERETTSTLMGGQKDEHGCIIPAGYSWCEAKQKCLRIWEEKCEVSSSSAESFVPPEPSPRPSHPTSVSPATKPLAVRYYTCPDGTKVVSCESYQEGTWACRVSPESQCLAQTPPVTAGTVCGSAGEVKYYACSDGTKTPWCICAPEGSLAGAQNKWQCQNIPVGFDCQKTTASLAPAPTVSSDYIKCAKGGTKDYKCAGGAAVSWQCECLNINPQATAYWDWRCTLKPANFCSAANDSDKSAVARIEIRDYIDGIQLFWDTKKPAISYMEYGPTTSYGSTAAGLTGPVGVTDVPDIGHVVEGQRLSVGWDDNAKLRPNTIYHFRIVTKDTDGATAVSDDFTFTTQSVRTLVPSTQVPVVTTSAVSQAAPSAAEQPLACCFKDGTCVYEPKDYCVNIKGGLPAASATCSPNLCPAPVPTPNVSNPVYAACDGGTAAHKCSDGTSVGWNCSCYVSPYPKPDASYQDRSCVVKPGNACPAADNSAPMTVTEISIGYYSPTKDLLRNGFLIFYWFTNTPARSYIEYGLTTAYGSVISGYGSTGTSDEFSTRHLVQNLGVGSSGETTLKPDAIAATVLKPDMLYHFRIVAKDASGNTFTSQDYTFNTNIIAPSQ